MQGDLNGVSLWRLGSPAMALGVIISRVTRAKFQCCGLNHRRPDRGFRPDCVDHLPTLVTVSVPLASCVE